MVKQRFALVRSPDGLITNVCVWDGVTEWNHLPTNINAVECPEEVSPGWSYSGGAWNPPLPPADPPPED